jgi:hypothetical protein
LIFAQKLKVDGFNRSYEKYRNSTNFDYLHNDFDSSKLVWVADLTVSFDTVIPGMIGESYKLFKARAHKFGANAFKVKDSDVLTQGGSKYISVSVYWLRMEDRKENDTLFRSNDIYLFGFLGHHEEIAGYEIELNKEDFILVALTFRKTTFLEGDRVSLQLGSKVRGTAVEFSVREGMYPKYYYFQMVRGSFKNSSIREYDRNFAMFLTQILQKVQ